MKLFYLILSLFSVIASFGQFGHQAPMSNQSGVLHREKIKDWVEIPSERKINSSAYLKPDGTIVHYFSREAVNYTDKNGNLVPVSTLPVVDETGWHAIHQNHPFSVLNDGSISSMDFNFSQVSKFNAEPYSHHMTEQHLMSDTLVLKDILPHIDKFFQFRNNGIKYSYVLNQPLESNSNFEITEIITVKDKGFSVVLNTDDDERPGFIEVLDGKGNITFTLAPIWCYDAGGKTVTGKYELKKISDLKYSIRLIVPIDYFSQPGLTYPVVIDPLITGPTTTWSGGVMPSCFAPAVNQDSIQITVPPQITVTNLSVSSNYYASPFTTTVMADGIMTFSTSCATSTNFTVAPPTGNFAGTGYLEDFNLNNPLMCCRPQSCAGFTFYLTMNLSRTSNGNTCNSTFLYYDPTALWPFSAYIEGHTIENYSSQAFIPNNTVCSNDCDFQLTTYSKYGVPPFTITHPWLATPLTSGTAIGCNSSFVIQTVTLQIPNCPISCDPNTSLAVPPPTVTDACGNTVASWPALTLNVKPVADVSATDDTVVVCSNQNAILNLNGCLPGSSISWLGHGTSGTGNLISDSLTGNSGIIQDTIVYFAYADLNGCIGDTAQFLIITEPYPIADFSVSPNPAFILDDVVLDDIIQTPGIVDSWAWDQSGNLISSDSAASLIFTDPGDYLICLAVQTQSGCSDTICKNVTVLPLEIVLPNVITPNSDMQNDFLSFQYLQFFDSNHLTIFNRWGKSVYEKENYQNDWAGTDLTEGVYYFVLKVEDKEYSGNFHLFR